ncbi:MAG: ankyrin repeat domain-containing protein [Bryobacterales bacterium]
MRAQRRSARRWPLLGSAVPAGVPRRIGNEAVTAGRDAGLAGWTGEEAPDFTITTLDGEEIHLSDLRGKRVVVGFWATWCGACIEQAPDLKRLMNETSRDELTVLGISWEDEDDLRSLSPSGTSITPSPPPKTCPSSFGDVTTFPTAIFIDAEGVIRGHKVGYSGFENLRDLALGLAFDEDAGDAEEVEAEEGWIDPETDDEGRTELLLAARDGDVDEIERLIADGAEPSERDRRGRTALAHAASAGEEKAIAMLLDAGADPNIADDAGHTPMAHAAISGHSAAVRALAEAGGSIDEPDFQGWTPLMHAARRGWADVVETLLELGRPGIKRSADGRTALDYAQASGYEKAAEALQKGRQTGSSWTTADGLCVKRRAASAWLLRS